MTILSEQSLSPRTLKSYKAHSAEWEGFCAANDHNPYPATPEAIVAWLQSLHEEGKSASTAKLCLAAIRWAHKQRSIECVTNHPTVTDTMRGFRRSRGDAKGKKALTLRQIESICRLLRTKEGIKPARDVAYVLLSFAGAFRRSEVAALTLEDLTFGVEGLQILIRQSKTDQFSEGTIKGIPYASRREICAASAIQDYIAISGITSGPLFRKILGNGKLGKEPMTGHGLNYILKKALLLVMSEKTAKDYSAHSFRAAFVTHAAQHGVPVHQIMRVTGHTSETTLRRYIRHESAFSAHPLTGIY